jgi:hypothetical protein
MNLYCKIFVDTDSEPQRLVDLIARILSAPHDRWTVNTTLCEIDVEKNEDFDQARRSQSPDGFLHYRYYLDIEPIAGADRAAYVESIGQLLNRLWDSGCRAVAACDFEEDLPRGGGYEGRPSLR